MLALRGELSNVKRCGCSCSFQVLQYLPQTQISWGAQTCSVWIWKILPIVRLRITGQLFLVLGTVLLQNILYIHAGSCAVVAGAPGLQLQTSCRCENQVCSPGMTVLQPVMGAAPLCISSAPQSSGGPGAPRPALVQHGEGQWGNKGGLSSSPGIFDALLIFYWLSSCSSLVSMAISHSRSLVEAKHQGERCFGVGSCSYFFF